MSTTGSSSGRVDVVSWSKDSIYVRWLFNAAGGSNDVAPSGSGTATSGYMIRYQAIGSNVVQLSQLLDHTASEYDITQLHENTNYDICVLRMRNRMSLNGTVSGSGGVSPSPTASMLAEASACVKGTTSTDSLSVALGSTFGAFLALGLIVALVFVAKWQHVRRAKKRLGAVDESEAVAEQDGIEDVLRVEMTVPDEDVVITSASPLFETPPNDNIDLNPVNENNIHTDAPFLSDVNRSPVGLASAAAAAAAVVNHRVFCDEDFADAADSVSTGSSSSASMSSSSPTPPPTPRSGAATDHADQELNENHCSTLLLASQNSINRVDVHPPPPTSKLQEDCGSVVDTAAADHSQEEEQFNEVKAQMTNGEEAILGD